MTSIEEERFLQRRKQQNNTSSSSIKNQRDIFFTTFRSNTQNLSRTIQALEDNHKQDKVLTSQQRHATWSSMSIQYKTLNKLLINYSISSSTTDIRILQNELDLLLQRLLHVKESILFPKNKFTFRRYHEWKRLHGGTDKNVDITLNNDLIEEKSELVNDGDDLQQSRQSSSFIIQDKTSETIHFPTYDDNNENSNNKQCLILKKCTDCNIQINECYQTIHILSCFNTTIKCLKPISSSMFINDCNNHCNIYITSCKQLRIHDSNQSNFFINSITTGPIIENCNQLVFSNDYENDDGLLSEEANSEEWKHVKDFSWLSILKPSPNFMIKEVVRQTSVKRNDSNYISNDVAEDVHKTIRIQLSKSAQSNNVIENDNIGTDELVSIHSNELEKNDDEDSDDEL